MNKLIPISGIICITIGVSAGLLTGCATKKTCGAMNQQLTGEPFGKTLDETPVEIYTLRNANGMTARIMTYGGIVQSLTVPDKNVNFGDVVLGYDTLDGYLTDRKSTRLNSSHLGISYAVF